jgi:hypothetical protein
MRKFVAIWNELTPNERSSLDRLLDELFEYLDERSEFGGDAHGDVAAQYVLAAVIGTVERWRGAR